MNTDRYNIDYAIKTGTYYHKDTPTIVCDILEDARKSQKRLKVTHGLNDVQCGYIARSCGPIKVPIMRYNTRAYGGPAMFDNYIVKIEYANKRDGAQPLYDVTR